MTTIRSRFKCWVPVLLAFLAARGALDAFDTSVVGFALENGDANGDQGRDLSDGVYLLDHLFLGGPPPVPLAYCGGDRPAVENGDTNGDGTIAISDSVRLLSWLFTGGGAPVDACALGDGGGADRNLNPRIIPIQAHAFGESYGEWSAKWWQWAQSFTAVGNPVLDTTGEFCGAGQTGKVWFLAGTFGGHAVTRACTVPAGQAIFFPLFNTLWGAPADCQGPPGPAIPCDVDALRASAAGRLTQVTFLEADIDGLPVQDPRSYRAPSPVFDITFPVGNRLGLPPGNYSPLISDGYFLLLAPLNAGEHVIHFHAIRTRPDGSTFNVEVTYNLTVGKA